jgi:hypothetical protein
VEEEAASTCGPREGAPSTTVARLEIHGMRIGSSLVSIRFRRIGSRCHVDRLDVTDAPLKIDIEMD